MFFTGKRSVRRYATAGSLFIRYLQDRGVLPPPWEPPSPSETWPLLGEFRTWMYEHRGVADSTLDNWQRDIVAFLERLGDDPQAYTAIAIRRFVRRHSRPFGIGRAKTVCVAIRAFLRFLIATGRCPVGRDLAVPTFASWQLTNIPRYLPAEDVERVIAACGGDRRLRDRAIVLLLARLGLRAGEVAKLKIADIDWRNGRLAVASAKSQRMEWLPLTQDVGDAIIVYLKNARPQKRVPNLFLTEFAPTRPITRVTVKCIVNRALARAGVRSANKGAHILRHSAATAMLRQGVSLDGVRAVLRHASPQMTMHYAKVDIGLLSEIAQPWAGRPSC
jgi:site-specific recombinase XerD